MAYTRKVSQDVVKLVGHFFLVVADPGQRVKKLLFSDRT
jgi:hypothetical protein